MRLVALASCTTPCSASARPIIARSAEPRATSACVRRPAGFWRNSRLTPTTAPTAVARIRRTSMACQVAGTDTTSINGPLVRDYLRSRRRWDVLSAEVAAARLHRGRRGTLHANIQAVPLGRVRGFDGEHVLLAQFADHARRDCRALAERRGEDHLAAGPVREVAQVARLRRRCPAGVLRERA